MPQRANFFNLHSGLRFKLFRIFTTLTALVTILFCTMYILNEIREQHRYSAEKVRLLAQQLAVTIRLPLYTENRTVLQQMAEEVANVSGTYAVVITTSDGRELVNVHRKNIPDSAEILSETVEVHNNSLVGHPDAATIDHSDAPGTLIGAVRMERSTTDMPRKIHQVVLASCSMAIAFWMAVSLLCYFTLKQLTRSYNDLVRGVELMQAGDYAVRIDVRNDDEPGRVALAINKLADSLQQRDKENTRLHEELLEAMRIEILTKEKLALLNYSLENEITEREALQDQLIKTQKLESLGVLAGGIAHNFNNVLTGVLGYISYARKFLDESHKADSLLQKAEKASKRAAGIAKQLLSFARGDTPTKKPVSIGKLIDESVSLALVGTNVLGVVDIPHSLHTVKADEGQLCQAFSNIIINAMQAMPGGGTITVCGENVTLDTINKTGLHPGKYIRLTFSDKGCGIPEEDLNKIFDPYFTTKSEVGPGLGLASVHSIIYKHGGNVSVHSVVGSGTTFIILLPSLGNILLENQTGADELGLDIAAGGSLLVMDDEEIVRCLAKDALGFLGYHVTTCRDGKEAIAMYMKAKELKTPYMAVLMDLTVPGGMGAVETAEVLLAFDPGAKLIVSSGYSNDPIMTGYKNYGFCSAVAKPYKAAELAVELRSLNHSL